MKWTAERLKDFRKRHGLNQAALAELIPFDITTIQFWEQERGDISDAGQWCLTRVAEDFAENGKAVVA